MARGMGIDIVIDIDIVIEIVIKYYYQVYKLKVYIKYPYSDNVY